MEHQRQRFSADKRWGVFRRDAQIDVAPCKRGGQLASGHRLGPHCPCHPREDHELYYATVYVHDNRLTEPSDGKYDASEEKEAIA
jgi:hypothetical protein